MTPFTTFLAQNPSGSNAGGAIFAGGFLLVILVLAFITSIFWIWMLIDCLISSKPAAEKLIWLLVIFFLHILGAVLYFFLGRGGKTGAIV